MGATTDDTGTIGFPSDDEHISGREADAATYVAAAIFNAVALPAGMPDYLRAVVESRVEQARSAAQDAGFVMNGGERLSDGKTRAEREKDQADTDMAYAAWVRQEDEQRREREREEWSRTASTVGGFTMTGAEWRKLADRLRDDDDLRRRLTDTFKARGMSDYEAQSRYDRIATVADIAAIPPSQRTDEQKQVVRQAEADPTFGKDMRDLEAAKNDRHASIPRSDLNAAFQSAADGKPSAGSADVTPTAQAKPIVQPLGMGI